MTPARRPALGLLALALGACPASDAPRDGADTAREDPAPADVSTLGGDAPDAAEEAAPDAASLVERRLTPRYDPAAAGLCSGAPADLFGQLVWVDAGGLWLAPHVSAPDATPVRIDSWGPELTPRSPVVAPPSYGGPALFVALAGPGGSELRAYDRFGKKLSTMHDDASDCTSPAAVLGILAWPVAGAANGPEGGRALIIDARRLRTLASVALGAHPLTPPSVLWSSPAGAAWVVGTADGVVAFRDSFNPSKLTDEAPAPGEFRAPVVLGRWLEESGVVTALAPASSRLVVALRTDDDGDDGLGAHLRVLDLVDSGVALAFAARGELIATPAPMRVPPLVIGGCASVAGGGSHWYCQGDDPDALVAAGDGWLRAWGVPSGAVIVDRDTPIRWTGLALGSGDWLAGGGSHWLPDDDSWALLAFDPRDDDDLLVELANGSAPAACIPSPLWDSDGDVAVPVLSGAAPEVVRAALRGPSIPLGLGQGAPRPLGDNGNSGRRTFGPADCPDDVLRDLNRMAIGSAQPVGVTSANWDVGYFGSDNGVGFVGWVALPTPLMVLVPSAVSIDHALQLGPVESVVAWVDRADPGLFHVADFRYTDVPIWQHDIADADPIALAPVVQTIPEVFVAGGATARGDRLVRIEPANGVVDDRTFLAADGPAGLVDLLSGGDMGAVMVMQSGDALVLRAIDGKLRETALATYHPDGLRARWVASSVDGGGHVRVLVATHAADDTRRARLLRFGPGLVLEDERPLPLDALGPMATLWDGSSLVAAGHALVRIAADGSVGLPRPWPDGLTPLTVPLAGAFGFVVAGRAASAAGVELFYGHADGEGFLGCADAGLCMAQPDPAACESDEACVQSGCAPATGACVVQSAGGCP
ncbi:MAG: hypothetical protein U1F43_08580 [Myxococcota bacterium]